MRYSILLISVVHLKWIYPQLLRPHFEARVNNKARPGLPVCKHFILIYRKQRKKKELSTARPCEIVTRIKIKLIDIYIYE